MDSEIAGLEDRHAYLKIGNNVARFQFDYLDVPASRSRFHSAQGAGGRAHATTRGPSVEKRKLAATVSRTAEAKIDNRCRVRPKPEAIPDGCRCSRKQSRRTMRQRQNPARSSSPKLALRTWS